MVECILKHEQSNMRRGEGEKDKCLDGVRKGAGKVPGISQKTNLYKLPEQGREQN